MNKLIGEISSLIREADQSAADLNKDGKEGNKKIGNVGFSLIKNMINTDNDVSGADVASYLQKADDINDEVDTVVFGLETDDNEIVKVYVAVPDADGFEKAMAEKLGTEDDIEDVIAELAQEFDIVDVEWPEGEDEDTDEKEPAETQNSAGEESEEATYELNFDADTAPTPTQENMEEDTMVTLGESFKQRVLGDEMIVEAKIKPEDWPAEISSFAKTLTTPGQESILYLISLFGLPREVLGSKKAIGLFRRNIIQTAREYQKNQTLKLWINKLIKELKPAGNEEEVDGKVVKEAINEKEKADLAPEWDDPKLAKAARFRDTLPRGIPRLVFDVLIGLGVPQVMLTDINKSKVRESIRAFSHIVRRTQRLRIYLNLIADALGIKAEDQTELAAHIATKNVREEVVVEALNEPEYYTIAHMVLDKLGIPPENFAFREPAVIQSFKRRKTQLNAPAVIQKLQRFLTFLEKNEIKKEAVEISEAMGLDYNSLVRQLAVALGFPADNLLHKEAQVIQALKKRKLQLNHAAVLPRLDKLVDQIEALTIKKESISSLTRDSLGLTEDEQEDDEQLNEAKNSVMIKKLLDDGEKVKSYAAGRAGMDVVGIDGPTVTLKKGNKTFVTTFDKGDKVKIVKKGNIYAIINPEDSESDFEKVMDNSTSKAKKAEAEDIGKWSYASLGSNGITLKARGVTIKLPVESAEKVVKAMGDGKPTTVKTSTGDRIIFSPRDRGHTYIIAGLDKFGNGVKLSKEDVEKFLDTLAK